MALIEDKLSELDKQLLGAILQLDPMAVRAALKLGANPNCNPDPQNRIWGIPSGTFLSVVVVPLTKDLQGDMNMSPEERRLRLEIAEVLKEFGGRYKSHPYAMQEELWLRAALSQRDYDSKEKALDSIYLHKSKSNINVMKSEEMKKLLDMIVDK